MKSFKTAFRTITFAFALSTILVSCTTDEIIETKSPSIAEPPEVLSDNINSHFFNNKLDTLSVDYPTNGTKIMKSYQNGAAKTRTIFNYNNRGQLLNVSNINYTTQTGIGKEINYTSQNNQQPTISFIKITHYELMPLFRIIKQEFEFYTHISPTEIQINKRDIHISTGATITSIDYSLKLENVQVGANNHTMIKSISHKIGSDLYVQNFQYDDKFNVYRNIQSSKELVLTFWNDQRITARNITQTTKLKNNVIVSDDKYTLTYESRGGCTERKLRNLTVDKYSIK